MPLDAEIIQPLLFEEEGAALDFKRAQYRFYGASDEEKAELLKDILAFTNSWRRTDAYILVGVEERQGERAKPFGVSEHLSDSDLQQFVNSKTNQPLLVAYRTCEIDGFQLGVIHVPLQERPRYLLKAFGKLPPNVVYVRRGSATEIAKPDEIARMGAAATSIAIDLPDLELRFADHATRSILTGEPSTESLILVMDDIQSLPDYQQGEATEKMYLMMANRSGNRAYWRDLAWHKIATNAFQPVNLAITNNSGVVALDVRGELSVPDERARMLDWRDFPERPRKIRDNLPVNLPIRHRDEPTFSVKRLTGRYVIELQAGKIQPRSTVWLVDPLYVGALASGPVTLTGVLTADNLPSPKPVSLTVSVAAEQRPFTFDDVQQIERERFMAEEGQAWKLAFEQQRKKPGG